MTTTGKAPARKAPQDHRAKGEGATSEVPDTHFAWTDPTGTTWVSTKAVRDVITPGLVRRNRSSDMSFTMEALELMFDDQPGFFAIVDESWDAMSSASEALAETFQRMGTSVGESSRSSA